MKFSIPKNRVEGFKLFAALGDSRRTQFISEILNYPSGYFPSFYEDELVAKFSIPPDDVNKILASIVGLIGAREYSNATLEVFVDGIITALNKNGVEGLTPLFRNNLLDLLNSENSFYITIKAGELIFNNENTLRTSRLLTDVRPVFTDKDSICKLTGSAIVHTLRIAYLSGGEGKEIHFSLDDADIKRLQNQLARAIVKEEVLRKEFKPEPFTFKKAE